MKHEIAPTVNFTKADGTAQLITLENAYDPTTIAGYMNDRVPQNTRCSTDSLVLVDQPHCYPR